METQTTQNETQQSNALLYTLIGVIVILLGYIGYVYASHDMVNKNELKEKYVLKNDINFYMLPSHIKSQYVEFYDHNEQVDTLKQKIQNLQTQLKEDTKIIEKVIEVPVEKVVEKIVEVEKMIAIPIEIEVKEKPTNIFNNANQFNTYTCKNMEEGSIEISQKCIKELHSFLDKNKEAKKFEVIGMVDNQDFKLINTLKDVYGEKKIKHLSKYSQIGLSRQRVIEASWLVREYIGDYKHIKTVNYTVHSKNKKGFIIRAYK